jgi:hypothetical protein
MVIPDDATNNVDAIKLRTVSIEYNIIPYRIQDTPMFSNLHKLGCNGPSSDLWDAR